VSEPSHGYNPIPYLFRFLGYLKARFNEPSTYAGIVLAIGGGANFSPPWSYLAVGVGILGVLVKGKDKCDAGHS
jgi:hypothetical protein